MSPGLSIHLPELLLYTWWAALKKQKSNVARLYFIHLPELLLYTWNLVCTGMTFMASYSSSSLDLQQYFFCTARSVRIVELYGTLLEVVLQHHELADKDNRAVKKASLCLV